MNKSSHLRVLPSAEAKPKRGKACYRITVWLTAAEWLKLQRQSTELERGKISFNKLFRKKFDLDDANETMDTRSVRAAIRHMHTPPVEQGTLVRARRRAAA